MKLKQYRIVAFPLSVKYFWWCLFVIAIQFNSVAVVRKSSPLIGMENTSPRNLFDKAAEYQKEEKLDSALLFYSWLAETNRDTGDKETRHIVGEALSEMGQIYYVNLSDYISAYKCLAEAENILNQPGLEKQYATVLLNLGNLFNIYEGIFPNNNPQQQSRSREYYDKAMLIALENKEWGILLSSYINSMMTSLPFIVDKKLNNRIRNLLKDSIPHTLPDYQLSFLLCKGTDEISERQFEQATQTMTEIRDYVGLIAPREKYMARICLASVSVAEGKFGNAIEYLNDIFSDPADINDIDVHVEIYDLLSKCHERAGDNEKSKFYRLKYFEAKDSLTKQIVGLEPTRMDRELDNVKEVSKKIDEERRQIQIVLWISIFVIIVVFIIALIIYRNNRKLKLKNQVIFNQTQSLLHEKESQPEKYRDSSMTDETRQNLISKIENTLENIEEICDSNFSLQRLTSLVGSNTSYISRIINEHYGMSFGNLLNKCRIQEACRRFGNPEKYGHLTIEAISESVGFNTRSTFTKAFRLNMGMLPSEYAKLLKKDSR